MAVNGIIGADYVIDELNRGVTYSQADCIHAAVINVIRNCPGGDPKYRCAGCTELWNSYDAKGKYHYITERIPLKEATDLLIGDLPVIYNANTKICEHIAYYMGGYKGYECIHSSKSKGGVCPTTLKNGFNYILRHKLITGVKGDDQMSQVLFTAMVKTENGKGVNFRSSPSTSSSKIGLIPDGTVIDVYDEIDGWYQTMYAGLYGYCSARYCVKLEDEPTDYPGNEGLVLRDVTLVHATGATIYLNGEWRVGED